MMDAARRLIRHRPAFATLIVALTLALRVLVPAGFMPVIDHGTVVVRICSGSLDGSVAMALAMPGMAHHSDPTPAAAGKCAYDDLTQAMTGGTDPLLLTAALAFVLALILAVAIDLPPPAAARLRPPLRGPPATA